MRLARAIGCAFLAASAVEAHGSERGPVGGVRAARALRRIGRTEGTPLDGTKLAHGQVPLAAGLERVKLKHVSRNRVPHLRAIELRRQQSSGERRNK